MFNSDHDKIATCSDDGTLRIWSISGRCQVGVARTNIGMDGNELPPDHATGDL